MIAEAMAVPDGEEMDRLHGQLVTKAKAEGLLDLAYRTIESPYGDFLVVVSPDGLMRVAFEGEDHDAVLAGLSNTVSPRILSDTAGTEVVARQFGEYFAGRRREFDLSVDLKLVQGFRRNVLEHLLSVPYGETATYTSLAAAAGSPRAVRAVGSACATNPVPIVVPCHRVVRSDGSTGQYRGGADTKVALLKMEAGSR